MDIVPLRRPWGLRLFLPLYKLARRISPKTCAPSDDPAITPSASAMLREGNWIYRLIFPRFFKKMSYQLPPDVDLVEYAKDGTLVYIGAQIHELEYNYFSHLFHKIGLPRSIYANGVSLRRYMVWPDLKATLCTQMAALADHTGIPHPAPTGQLQRMIIDGYSVLFSIARAELCEESPMLSESHQLILAAIHAQEESHKPVYLVPLNFIWDRRPTKAGRRSIIDALFGEKDDPGSLRKTVMFWRNYKRRALVQINAPINIQAYHVERPDLSDEELATHIRRRILESLLADRRAVTGPPARPQRWFVERVVTDKKLIATLSSIAVERHKTLEQLVMMSRQYAKEIAANLNYKVIAVLDRLMGWVFRNLYEDVSVDTENLARIKELSAYTPLIFVPNHRSHVDYLLLSYIFHHSNMIVPHIAAGINLAFWPLGAIFRRCGAFFIRRTFAGNDVYRATFSAYLSLLLAEGYNQEFFIEGGRSRTGKLMPPRLGMISMYADSMIAGAVPDLLFVPVSVTYDRVLEQASYENEQEGASKKGERARDIMGLTKYLRRQKMRNGTIFVRFGTPVSMSGAAHDCGIDKPLNARHKPAAVRMLADQVCHELNRHMVVTSQAVTAMALLLKPRRAVTIKELETRVQVYLEYLNIKNIEMSEALRHDPMKAMRDALAYFAEARMVRFHDDPEFPFYEVMEDKRITLDYYKNGALHFFASLAFACLILEKCFRAGAPCTAAQIAPEFDFLQSIFQFEFRFNQRVPLEDRLTPLVGFLAQKGAVTLDEDGSVRGTEHAQEILDLFADLVRNAVDAYKGAMAVLKRNADEVVDERALIKLMLDTGPKLFLMGYMSRREAVTKENFAHALAAFHQLGAITLVDGEGANRRTRRYKINLNNVKTLQAELEKVT